MGSVGWGVELRSGLETAALVFPRVGADVGHGVVLEPWTWGVFTTCGVSVSLLSGVESRWSCSSWFWSFDAGSDVSVPARVVPGESVGSSLLPQAIVISMTAARAISSIIAICFFMGVCFLSF